MAQLKDFLGGILRDVVQARVAADLVSRDVSEEYRSDPLLIAFPVPRAEIREVSAQFRFAVNAVEAPQPDAGAARQRAAVVWSGDVARAVFEGVILKNPLRDELMRITEAKGLQFVPLMQEAAAKAVVEDARLLELLLQDQPEGVLKVTVNATYQVVTTTDDDVRKLLQRQGLNPIRAQIQEIVAGMLPALKDLLQKMAELQGQKAARVDLALTRRELADAPEYLLSSVTVTVALRNYEWSRTIEDGKEVIRLNPE